MLRAVLQVLGFAAVLSSALPASAQGEPSEQRARELFVEARTAFDEGRFPEARALLEESLTLSPRPASAMNLSRVLRSTGELLAAETMLEEILGGGYGLVEGDRRQQATTLLEEVRGAIGTFEVSVVGVADAQIQLDGVIAGRASPGAPLSLRVDPGDHVVTGVVEGARSERSLTVGPGDQREVALEIEPASAGAETGTDDGGSILASPWFWVIAGVLVAGGVTATVLLATSGRTADPVTDPVFPTATVLLGP